MPVFSFFHEGASFIANLPFLAYMSQYKSSFKHLIPNFSLFMRLIRPFSREFSLFSLINTEGRVLYTLRGIVRVYGDSITETNRLPLCLVALRRKKFFMGKFILSITLTNRGENGY